MMIPIIFNYLPAILFLIIVSLGTNVNVQNALGAMVKPYVTGPTINDPDLKTEVVFKNNGKLDIPTTGMAFVGPNDILVLEKIRGLFREL